jgi:hypothetical protein
MQMDYHEDKKFEDYQSDVNNVSKKQQCFYVNFKGRVLVCTMRKEVSNWGFINPWNILQQVLQMNEFLPTKIDNLFEES